MYTLLTFLFGILGISVLDRSGMGNKESESGSRLLGCVLTVHPLSFAVL